MALKPDTNFAGKINPATSAYPYGSARNVTTQDDGTGTPFIDLLINDNFGWQQALLDEAGIVPSGSPDSKTTSQYMQAFKKVLAFSGQLVFNSTADFSTGTLANGVVLSDDEVTYLLDNDLTVKTNGFYSGSTTGNATYKFLNAADSAAAGYVDGISRFQIRALDAYACLIVDLGVDVTQLGANGTSDDISFQQALNLSDLTEVPAGGYSLENFNVSSNKNVRGVGDKSLIVYSGSGGDTIISANNAPSAIQNTTIDGLMIDANVQSNVTCVELDYYTVQSHIKNIRVGNFGAGCVGFLMGNMYYASTENLSVRNGTGNGTGLKVDTSKGQFNNVPLDIQVNGCDEGVIIDTTSNYVYQLKLDGEIENNNVGLRVIKGFGVRQANITAYFEANSTADVIWGATSGSFSDTTQTVNWIGASFNPNGSRVELYEGNHMFYGVDRIDTLVIGGTARVEMFGCYANTIVNNTGDPTAYTVRPAAGTTVKYQQFAGGTCPHISGASLVSSDSGTPNEAVFSLPSYLTKSAATNGSTIKVSGNIRQNYKSTGAVTFEGFLNVNNVGVWGFDFTAQSSNYGSSGTTLTVDTSNGDITLTSATTDTTVYSVLYIPM